MQENEELYNKLLERLNTVTDEPEFKPVQNFLDKTEKISNGNLDNQLELVKKENNSKIDHQLYILCENIVFTFFGLPADKFYAALERSKVWGLDICIEEFIMNYYLLIKNNNRLKEFILLYFQKIIKNVVLLIEKQLTTKINLQDFTSNEIETHQLQNNLSELETTMKDGIPENIKPEKKQKKINNEIDTEKIKQNVLKELKSKNKIFDEI